MGFGKGKSPLIRGQFPFLLKKPALAGNVQAA